ncbi:PqqD family protein [Streptomyces filamentosus]|uniref:PqqD family protein n=1 Tax=Streptomyces filamentosus TaxID=67294 RepID=UPI0012386F8F|nr:PqqD family protein [Streptomyces filamentosus]KAA6211316.1 PqqD family protein [Streptomyces filamentosus]
MEDDDLWTRVRPTPGVTGEVTGDGGLVLRCTVTGRCWRSGSDTAAMWIALQQHRWRLAPAAVHLGRVWAMDPLLVRVALGRWVEELQAHGVVEEEPPLPPGPRPGCAARD